MSALRASLLSAILALLAACGPSVMGPDPRLDPDETDGPEKPTAAGAWSGSASTLSLALSLSAAGDGALSGTGTLVEAGQSTSLTVTGTHRHPNISLTVKLQGGPEVSYQGKLKGKKEINGTLSRPGSANVALTLKRK